MKRKEVIHYLINNELMKEKAFSNVKEQLIKKKIEKLMNTKGTYEYNLDELYSMYYEEEDNKLREDIGKRILKLVPKDFDILSDNVYCANTSTVEKIKGLELLEKECVNELKEKEFPLDGSDDLFCFVEGREYIRLLDKIAVCYLDINKKEEYLKTAERILFLNPADSLSMLDNLSLMYFNNKEYVKIQDLYKKHPKNLILQTLDYAIKFHEGKDVKKEMKELLKRNHFIVYYFANYLEIRQKALDNLKNINYFPYGSIEETLLALLDIEDTLDNEALELYMKAFLSYRGDAIIDYLSEDEINAMFKIFDECNYSDKDPTKERIFKAISEQKKQAILEERKFIPNDDRKFLSKMLDTMVDKYLIEINDVRVSLSLGGMMHIYTIMKFNQKDEEEETFVDEENVKFS
ncbi:MAG: hypothetical protein E7177_00300 [Erysipelotrichaceae bacterium]|nr:hypothetical protein [Erysipelotrichaceae bacterium]